MFIREIDVGINSVMYVHDAADDDDDDDVLLCNLSFIYGKITSYHFYYFQNYFT